MTDNIQVIFHKHFRSHSENSITKDRFEAFNGRETEVLDN